MKAAISIVCNIFFWSFCIGLSTKVVAQVNTKNKIAMKSGYAHVNNIDMYYEIHGKGLPLVLIHGGGSTIGTTFGIVLPMLAQTRQVIAVELQGHGHTKDIDRPLSFEQDADDVAALLKQLNISKADIFGFSNGGSTAMQIAIRHPEVVRKLVVASAAYRRDAFYPEFWTFMPQASLENMPKPLQDEYLKITNDLQGLRTMHDRDKQRMLDFKDWPADALRSIQVPVLFIDGDKDVVKPEHTIEMYRLVPNARLAILPGGHGEYIDEIMFRSAHSKLPELTVTMVNEFLDI